MNFRNYLTEDGYYLKEKDYNKVKGLGAAYSFGGMVKDDTPIYNTITASYGKVSGNSMKFTEGTKYRYLNPMECWMLMGFDRMDYVRANKRLVKSFYKNTDRSDSQMYKQAGNSIVVNVIEELFKELL